MKLNKSLKKLTVCLFTMLIVMSNNFIFATGIGTAEIATATENIKRVITSIAMPLRRSFNFC